MEGTLDAAHLERIAELEAIKASILALSGNIGRMGFKGSLGGNVERGTRKTFSLSIYDNVTGESVPQADIDQSGISIIYEKDTGAGFSPTGLTPPVFTPIDGLLFSEHLFANGEWSGDQEDGYHLIVSGVEATIDGVVYKIPTCLWSGRVAEAGDHTVALNNLIVTAGNGFVTVEALLNAIKLVTDKQDARPKSLTIATRSPANIGAGEVEITNTTQHTSTRDERVVVRVRGTSLVAAAANYTIRAEVLRSATILEKILGTVSKSAGPTNIERDADPITLENADVLRVFLTSSDAGDSAVGIEAEIDEVQ